MAFPAALFLYILLADLPRTFIEPTQLSYLPGPELSRTVFPGRCPFWGGSIRIRKWPLQSNNGSGFRFVSRFSFPEFFRTLCLEVKPSGIARFIETMSWHRRRRGPWIGIGTSCDLSRGQCNSSVTHSNAGNLPAPRHSLSVTSCWSALDREQPEGRSGTP